LIIRQPWAPLWAMIVLNISRSARSFTPSPSRKATVRAVLLLCSAVMICSGSVTIPPSYRKTLTWSFCREQGADVAVQDEVWLDGSLDCFLDGGIGSVHQVPYLPADCLLPRGESSMYWSTRGSLL
jgi:hypothetical protein